MADRRSAVICWGGGQENSLAWDECAELSQCAHDLAAHITTTRLDRERTRVVRIVPADAVRSRDRSGRPDGPVVVVLDRSSSRIEVVGARTKEFGQGPRARGASLWRRPSTLRRWSTCPSPGWSGAPREVRGSDPQFLGTEEVRIANSARGVRPALLPNTMILAWTIGTRWLPTFWNSTSRTAPMSEVSNQGVDPEPTISGLPFSLGGNSASSENAAWASSRSAASLVSAALRGQSSGGVSSRHTLP